jgi:hypothetical protein
VLVSVSAGTGKMCPLAICSYTDIPCDCLFWYVHVVWLTSDPSVGIGPFLINPGLLVVD